MSGLSGASINEDMSRLSEVSNSDETGDATEDSGLASEGTGEGTVGASTIYTELFGAEPSPDLSASGAGNEPERTTNKILIIKYTSKENKN